MAASSPRRGWRLLPCAILAVPLLAIASRPLRHAAFAALRPVCTRRPPVRAPGVARFAQPPLTAPDGTQTSASGLAWEVLRPGSGLIPTLTSDVTVHYRGWRASTGDKFDDSYLSGQPAVFKLDAVIAGWQEGVRMMREGEKCRFWVPAKLAYGPADPSGKEQPVGPPKGDLVYEMELIKVENAENDVIFSVIGGAAAFLALITLVYSLTAEPAERAEYETGPALIGFKQPGA